MAEITTGRYYPDMPPMLDGETLDAYTDRLTGADGADRRPYDHPRRRQCSIGYHDECSDPEGYHCQCPCHTDPQQLWNPTRRFQLHRDSDVTGASGTGLVADGVEWPDGTVSIRWRGERPSVVFWQSQAAMEDVYAIHGHGGATRIVWLDLPATNPAAPVTAEEVQTR